MSMSQTSSCEGCDLQICPCSAIWKWKIIKNRFFYNKSNKNMFFPKYNFTVGERGNLHSPNSFLHNVLNFFSRFLFKQLLIHLVNYVIDIVKITTVYFISKSSSWSHPIWITFTTKQCRLWSDAIFGYLSGSNVCLSSN
jgi:hypothetical protein